MSGEIGHRIVDAPTGCGEQCECGNVSPTVEAHEAHARAEGQTECPFCGLATTHFYDRPRPRPQGEGGLFGG